MRSEIVSKSGRKQKGVRLTRLLFGRSDRKIQKGSDACTLTMSSTIGLAQYALDFCQRDLDDWNGVPFPECFQSGTQERLFAGKMWLRHPAGEHAFDTLGVEFGDEFRLFVGKVEPRLAAIGQHPKFRSENFHKRKPACRDKTRENGLVPMAS